MVPSHQVTENQQQEDSDLIKPRKLPNPVLASHQHRALHQELLFCHRRWENTDTGSRRCSQMLLRIVYLRVLHWIVLHVIVPLLKNTLSCSILLVFKHLSVGESSYLTFSRWLELWQPWISSMLRWRLMWIKSKVKCPFDPCWGISTEQWVFSLKSEKEQNNQCNTINDICGA